MKFAKELEDELVPEWKVKYFNYKQGKKKIKAIQRAVRSAHRSPATPSRRVRALDAARRTTQERTVPERSTSGSPLKPDAEGNGSQHESYVARRSSDSAVIGEGGSAPIPIPNKGGDRPSSTAGSEQRTIERGGTVWTRYGSIIGSPPSPALSRPDTLNLPEPAMDPEAEESLLHGKPGSAHRDKHWWKKSSPGDGDANAFEVGKSKHPTRPGGLAARHMSLISPARLNAIRNTDAPLFKRLFTSKHGSTPKTPQFSDVPLDALKEIEAKQAEFWTFLDKEMEKIEAFYKSKEDEASKRLQEIREQLHILRDQRLEELVAAQKARAERKAHKQSGDDRRKDQQRDGRGILSLPNQLKDIPRTMDVLYHPLKAAKRVQFKQISPNHLVTPQSTMPDSSRDYSRRAESAEVPYHTAKRKLKAAMQEFYRGLELLKSFALLNRTAFRKINKKYDKAVHARPTMRYMTERVDNAYFVKSTAVDDYITATEDLYARYFEKGSHKVAVGKLRRKTPHSGEYTRSVFRNGLTAAAGAIFGIEGLVYAANLYYSGDEPMSTLTSYLLQVYGGYFLLLFLVLFFCIDCEIFTRAKINYAFVFEFDNRHSLDWRQLSELPCFFLFLMGLVMWLNFSRVGGDTMYVWWPVILVGLTFLVIFLPFRILYFESRKWFLFSLWRLLLPGIYPVEFRDFFMGDMLCSQTYSLGNIELFFCLYAHSWSNPDQCNSSHSRLLGFLMTVPGIMRLFQCLRRYYDTRNIFPHLVNGGKYTFTILQYMSLSLFRLQKTESLRALFVTCATINGMYTSVWDLVMDWSLMDPYAPHPFLRQHIAIKSPIPYYVAMVIDPLLRFNWVFYAIPYFTDEIQHSAILGFAISFSEVIRRGIWTIFRVENEHCTNVMRYRASRDKPLPYQQHDSEENQPFQRSETPLPTPNLDATFAPGTPGTHTSTTRRHSYDPESAQADASGASLQRANTHDTAESSLRRRQQQGARPPAKAHSIRSRAGTILHAAHAQDYERRKKGDIETEERDSEDDDEDEQDYDDEEEEQGQYGTRVGDEEDDDEEEEARARQVARETAANDRIDRQEASAWAQRARNGWS